MSKIIKIFMCVIWYSFFIVFWVNLTYSESCKYLSKINECIEARNNWNTNSITDFVCINNTNEDIKYQIVLDQEFKKMDEKMDKFLFDLDDNKNLYFWSTKKMNFIDGMNDIFLAKKYFRKSYRNICNEKVIIWVSNCNKDWKISTQSAKNYFSEGNYCRLLVETKLEIFENVAFDIMILNKKQTMLDDKKRYDIEQRKDYNRLLDIMNVNISYMERIWQKWTKKLSNPY